MRKEMEMKEILGTTNKGHVGRMSGSLARRAVGCLMVRCGRLKDKKIETPNLMTSSFLDGR
jgi:hypothetical protein